MHVNAHVCTCVHVCALGKQRKKGTLRGGNGKWEINLRASKKTDLIELCSWLNLQGKTWGKEPWQAPCFQVKWLNDQLFLPNTVLIKLILCNQRYLNILITLHLSTCNHLCCPPTHLPHHQQNNCDFSLRQNFSTFLHYP